MLCGGLLCAAHARCSFLGALAVIIALPDQRRWGALAHCASVAPAFVCGRPRTSEWPSDP
eukprot:CAMPEP_0119369134 /NCGR_PEP_ID=MMETSP1334-20130426/15705_1 /TAXON_ID=127549 /ORGANISM="Calcidiscus leptoporus, Strain RCC1130" /LENGTH=59 /DNA_ID=CAMNT_0007385927 /DNA_START=476 /DNA_END=652 /DNA_ORIENTATION=-